MWMPVVIGRFKLLGNSKYKKKSSRLESVTCKEKKNTTYEVNINILIDELKYNGL